MSHKRSRKAQRRRQTRTWAECAHEKTEFKLANIQSSWPNPDNALIKTNGVSGNGGRGYHWRANHKNLAKPILRTGPVHTIKCVD